MYLHEWGDDGDIVTKEEMTSGKHSLQPDLRHSTDNEMRADHPRVRTRFPLELYLELSPSLSPLSPHLSLSLELS